VKFTVGLLTGVAIGFAVASKLFEREVVEARRERTTIASAMTRHPSSQRFSGSSRRIIDLAGERGAEAVRRARQNIQRRLEASTDDLSMN
jgi:uncharacterized protein YneF (UPF0154 family)